MKILVRLPNWLGDMVMATGFIHQLQISYPGCEISVIAKKGIDTLLDFFPDLRHRFVFDKARYQGVLGAWRFGRTIKRTDKFDLFFCLPNSFSSAFMGRASGARKRIGFKSEMRNFLLTHSYMRPTNVHRAEEYIHLIKNFSGKQCSDPRVSLAGRSGKSDFIAININSEASSRRLTEDKAVAIIEAVQSRVSLRILLIGSAGEEGFVTRVVHRLGSTISVESLAGKTSLKELTTILASSRLLLSTDSGPAHLANALGTYTIVLFGAGNEMHTAPYNADLRKVIRLGKLSCEPCQKNVCVRYGLPQCLIQLDSEYIADVVKTQLESNGA